MKLKYPFTLFLLTGLIIIGCQTNNPANSNQLNVPNSSNKTQIDENLLINTIKILASDSLEGRGFSKPGNYKAQQLIANEFEKLQLASPLDSGYIQPFTATYEGKRRQRMFPIKVKEGASIPDTTGVGGNVVSMV